MHCRWCGILLFCIITGFVLMLVVWLWLVCLPWSEWCAAYCKVVICSSFLWTSTPLRLNFCSLASGNNLPKSTTPHLTPLTPLKTLTSYSLIASPFPTRSHPSRNPAIGIRHIRQLSCIRLYLDYETAPLPSPLPLFTPSLTTATLFITASPSLRPPGSNRPRTLLHVLLSEHPNPVTSLPSYDLSAG